jgi:hypothetical protein
MATFKSHTAWAGQPTYELQSLGWKAFQQLCVTVVSEVWGQTVQGFFDSHDGGRDGAFYGIWSSSSGESFDGNFTIQCKFSQRPNQNIGVGLIRDEIEKARRLSAQGLAENYFLFTNMQLTGTSDEAIRSAFEALPGLRHCRVYGVEQISQFIRESPRLRTLVPRIYGLGDLGQILDKRRYDQAQEILSSLGDDMNKFVMTDAFRASARAIVEHDFVLLLGEPACGKSAIAAALALGALDEWGCFTVKVRGPSDFVAASNPHEKQFFWVDDAFGATQLDWQNTVQWNGTFPHVRAAIRRGAKFVFTSRDYIYRNARNFLKESALPPIVESQVIIRVEQLSKEEREQILYNHIRLGTQSRVFKAALKPFLNEVAANKQFTPEIARRLGNLAFTKQLAISADDLDDFIERPIQLLQEVIRTLDAASRAAIALVFMRGGWVVSPVSLLPQEETAIASLGATSADVRAALGPLDGSLLLQVRQKGEFGWRAKHPTILDAFAALVAADRELMDIYLMGTPVRQLLSEIVCGETPFDGVKVDVPRDRYDGLIERIRTFEVEDYKDHDLVNSFLAYRCGKEFIQHFIEKNPSYPKSLHVGSYFYAVTSVKLINKLHAVDLLAEDQRLKHVSIVRQLAVEVPDDGFLDPKVISFLKRDEVEEILGDICEILLPNINHEIEVWKENYPSDESPSDYFYTLKRTLSSFASALAHDPYAVALIDKGKEAISNAVLELESEADREPDYDDFSRLDRSTDGPSASDARSIFDDVDT